MAGSDWEVVSLTASTYAAAPGGPTSPPPPPPTLLHPLHNTETETETETELPPLLLVPNPPAPPPHLFMSQHFNLPKKEPLFSSTHLLENTGGQELESDDPAVPDADADGLNLNMPCPQNYWDDAPVLASPAGSCPQEEGGGGEEPQQTTMPCSLPDAAAVGSSALPADATAAAPSGGGGVGACNCNAAQAWWEKTFSFPRSDGTQPLAFRFVFVAGKLQIQEEDNLRPAPVPEFGQTQKISCVSEPLGQVKVGMLGGGSPVAQQG